MDAISMASRNVAILLNRNLSVPPIPIKTIRKNENKKFESPMYQAVELVDKVQVFEIWQVFLEENQTELDSVFVIISAISVLNGYRNAEWENINYEGFFTTMEEAKNEIMGYIR